VPSTPPYLSLGELGDLLSVQSWRIARLFELGVIPEPPRVGGRRLIPKTLVPQVVDALRERDWLPRHDPDMGPCVDDRLFGAGAVTTR